MKREEGDSSNNTGSVGLEHTPDRTISAIERFRNLFVSLASGEVEKKKESSSTFSSTNTDQEEDLR